MPAESISIAIGDDELVALVRAGPILQVEIMPLTHIPMECTAWIHLIEKRCGRGE